MVTIGRSVVLALEGVLAKAIVESCPPVHHAMGATELHVALSIAAGGDDFRAIATTGVVHIEVPIGRVFTLGFKHAVTILVNPAVYTETLVGYTLCDRCEQAQIIDIGNTIAICI